MIALPDDDHVVAVAHEGRDRAVRDMDQRTGGLDDVEAAGAGFGQRAL